MPTTEANDADAGPPPARSANTTDTTMTTLSAAQLHALFDILTHYETYYEVQDFRDPDTIFAYGTPFVERKSPAAVRKEKDGKEGKEYKEYKENKENKENKDSKEGRDRRGSTPVDVVYAPQSRSPILHMLFNKTVMTLPPAQTLPPSFWNVRVQGLLAQLAEAELSESYDQGAMGTRKMLATASSALIESLGRGALGGYPVLHGPQDKDKKTLVERTYDTQNAADFSRAWDDVLRAMVYDDLVDELFAYCATHPDVEGHSPAVAAAADYIIVHVAEFLHYVFVLSPNGRYLTKLVESVQQLVPYTLVRQTLRVSNAATMINGMMKLLLAKLSVGGLTNWMGLTSTADDGMNLLQRIVSLVLSYDASNFKKAADKIEKERTVRKAQLAAIREHMARPRAYHEAVRRESATTSGKDGEHTSMVVAILESVDPSLATSLTETQHAQLAQYNAALLSVHDRREITNVFCRQSPDLFTQALRDGVAAFDPIIRGIHDKIDLKEHVSDIEGFINEFIDISKGTKPKPSSSKTEERTLPTVKDYVELLRRNRHLLYKWLHRVAHDTPDIRDTFRVWAIETIKLFRGPEATGKGEAGPPSTTMDGDLSDSRLEGGAGAMDPDLRAMFTALPATVQTKVAALLDDHVVYLGALDAAAAQQRQVLLDKINAPPPTAEDDGTSSSSKQAPGSGRFIARWQELLDDTVIGPSTAHGPLRHGKDVAHVTAPGKTGASASSGTNGSSGSASGSTASSKPYIRKHDGFLSGISSALSSRNTSPERAPTPIPTSAATPGRVDVGPRPPNVLPVVDALGPQFRQLLVERTARRTEAAADNK